MCLVRYHKVVSACDRWRRSFFVFLSVLQRRGAPRALVVATKCSILDTNKKRSDASRRILTAHNMNAGIRNTRQKYPNDVILFRVTVISEAAQTVARI